ASKVSKAVTVYRGTSGGRLPNQFWVKDDTTGVKGGVEYGFLSTTVDRQVARQYSGGAAGTILEIQTGMIDKGADLSWISQYPHEAELCFPPLTNMEVLGTKVDGSALVVSIRLNLNLTCPTIDDVIGKRKKMVVGMCENLKQECYHYLNSDLWAVVLEVNGAFFRCLAGAEDAQRPERAAEAADALERVRAERARRSEHDAASKAERAAWEAFVRLSPGFFAAAAGEVLARAAQATEEEGRLIHRAVEGAFPARLEEVLAHPADRFNEDDFFKERVAEALAVKESLRLALGDALALAAEALERAAQRSQTSMKETAHLARTAAAHRACSMAAALRRAEHVTAYIPVSHGDTDLRRRGLAAKVGLEARPGGLFATNGGLLAERGLPAGPWRLARAVPAGAIGDPEAR
ncbi:unnamed protein product, partial [Prorocentrum cordatum]